NHLRSLGKHLSYIFIMKQKLFLILCLTGLIRAPLSKFRPAHHKYYLIMQSYTWPQAQNYCRVTYGDIATVITKEDWLKLNQEAASKHYSSYVWIGLYNGVNSWMWSDGTVASNLPWAAGEPRSYNGLGNCVSTQLTVVNSFYCSQPAYFVCHTIIPMRVKQVIKLQVKSDGSVFDPAVQSSILGQ
ncbi:macrophage mannose receptor 1-like isoform X6, partial [Clarias magur]